MLPLLSHALDQTWCARTGETLTLADYERTGGIEGAVAASAQRAYDGLTPAQQETARQVFTQLTATSADSADTAARASRAELIAGLSDDRARDVAVVLETFAAERLLTLDAGAVEISHEALLTAWPLLRDTWLADARADRVTRTRLRATAREWALASGDPSYLYHGSRLDAAASTAARVSANPRHAPLSQAEKDFLRASQRASRRATRARQQLTALLLALVAALGAVWIVAVRAGQAAVSQRDIADSRLLISESEAVGQTNATVSQLEAIAAWSLDPSPQARSAMLAAAASPQVATISTDADEVDSLAFSPDGKILATGSFLGAAQLWDVPAGRETGKPRGADPGEANVLGFVAGGKILVTYSGGVVEQWGVSTGRRIGRPFTIDPADGNGSDSVALSPDGTTLAMISDGTGASTGAFRLWNVATGRPVGEPVIVGTAASILAFSADGKILATVDNDGTVHLWDVATGQQIGRPLPDPAQVDSAAFSPDGETLATGGQDGSVRLWDVATGREIGGPLPGGSSAATRALMFSPDGTILAAGSDDGTLRLWNAATGQLAGAPITTSAAVDAIAFSPDGETLATGNGDGTARLWDVPSATFRQIGSAIAPPGNLGSLTPWAAFSPDGRTLVSYVYAARRWDAASWRQIGQPFAGDNGNAASAALSPDGGILAIGTDNEAGSGTVQLWDVSTGQQMGKPLPVPNGADSVVFTPNGRELATVDENGTVRLWEVSTGREIGKPLPVAGQASGVAFTPDGTMLAARNDSGPVRRWDAATGRQSGQAVAGDAVSVAWMALSPDGNTLATGDDNDTVHLWDFSTGQPISSMPRLTSDNPVVFSPDGALLATVNDSDEVQLWDVATGQQIGGLMSGTLAITGQGSVAIFSPDGRTLAIVDGDGTVRLWNVSYLTDPLAQLCARIGGSITLTEWAKYVPAGPAYRNACG